MRIFILFAFAALFSSCTQKKTLIIDNPTRKAIEVSFEEGLKRTVDAKSQERIIITQSSTTVYLNGNKVGDITFDSDSEYLLNPTLSNYYISEVSYGGSPHTKPQGTKNDVVETELSFDDIPFKGFVRKDKSLLITNVWDYGAEVDLPFQKEDVSPNLKRKIYREIDFERYAKKRYYDALRKAQ